MLHIQYTYATHIIDTSLETTKSTHIMYISYQGLIQPLMLTTVSVKNRASVT